MTMTRTVPDDAYHVAHPCLRLVARHAPHDERALGYPVVAISEIEVIDPRGATTAYDDFVRWLARRQVRLVSCRLAHHRLGESMFLEQRGFRFVEMMLTPSLAPLTPVDIDADGVTLVEAAAAELPALCAIAGRAFRHERYHVDPRVETAAADQRYANWVADAASHPRQQVLAVREGDQPVGVFVVEHGDDGDVYWHLTAIDPRCQGRGLGTRTWSAMLNRHHAQGMTAVRTRISARNVAVLNLYTKLGFRFGNPEMTFHRCLDGGEAA